MRRLGLLLALAAGCFTTRYVGQAALGQLDLWTGARPVAEVIADPDTDERTRALLVEAGSIVAFAERNGLPSRGNYRRYVDLHREAVVWFVTASRPLAFEQKEWWFPIVGSFTYLGWFDMVAARRHRDQLAADGWDVYVRPVSAYSTGGWFRDPILSTMLRDDDGAIRDLANVLIHELVHANVLVADQSTFNESVASFVGDGMAASYLAWRFGEESAELAAYRAELEEDRVRGERMSRAYVELDALYASDAGDADKRAGKARILAALDEDLHLRSLPNNAMVLGFKTYNSGKPELASLFEACGRSWPRTIAALGTVRRGAFASSQQDDLSAVIPKRCP